MSLYLDIKTSPIPAFLIKALDYCKQHGYAILIGSDTNSHSTLWGKETNQRGEKLEELIEDYGLDIHNIGKTPTYDCSLGQSVIDVTLSLNLKLTVDNWRICKIYNGSDHHSINYTLKTELIEIQPHRNYDKANWDELTWELRNLSLIHI